MMIIDKINYALLSFFRYRIHISFLYFLILQKFWIKINDGIINWPVVFSFTLWHYGIYLFDRVYDCEKDIYSQQNESVPLSQQKLLFYFIAIIFFLPLVILFYNDMALFPYLVAMPFAFFYTIPLWCFKKRLKDLLIVKNLYSAVIIWSGSIFFSIVNYSNLRVVDLLEFNRFYQLLIITFVVEVLWDIRDLDGDMKFGIKTLPNTIGVNSTKLLLLLILSLSFIFFHTSFVTFFSLCLVIFLSNRRVSNIIYHIPLLLNVVEFYIK